MRPPLIIGLIVGALAFLILLVVGVVAVLSALDRSDALADHRAAAEALQVAVADADVATAEADEVLPFAENPYLPSTEFADVAATQEAATAVLGTADTMLGVDPERLGTAQVRAATRDMSDVIAALDADDADVIAALEALLAATATAAPDVESANFDANNEPHIAFRAAVDDLGLASDTQIGESLAAYLGAAEALAASHAAELAEKAGPLFDARMAVQEFARSLAGGVLLEFDWARVVNGYGTGGSYGGTSYWLTADGGQATVTLSDSVASMWPSAGVQSLVAHEVGHAILSRSDCNSLFFSSDFSAGGEEPWATAWAISLGYTADGSGESIYGRPSDGLIDLAAQCR